MNRLKEQLKHLEFGILHVLVAITSILFVSNIVGVDIRISFLSVGISTLIFHLYTKNKLSSLLGLSASYIGGMLLIKESLGKEYVMGGVVLVGVIYFLLGLLLKVYPKLLNRIPQYIFSLSVVFIALLLIPIGFSMMQTPIGYATFILLTLLYLIPQTRYYAMPLSLLVMGLISYQTGILAEAVELTELSFVMPKFSMKAFTTISLVSLAVLGEVVGDNSKTAKLNGLEFGKDISWSNVFLGNGIANLLAGFIGSPPTVSYTENNAFLETMGKKDLDPIAQVYAGLIFIILAFIPKIAILMSRIPLPVFGALLTFLFINLGINTMKEVEFNTKKAIVFLIGLFGFVASYNSTTISPITVTFLLTVFASFILNKINLEKIGG